MGIIELPAAGERDEVHSPARQSCREPGGGLGIVAARDTFIGEHAAADHVVRADRGAHSGQNIEGQADAALRCAAVTVAAVLVAERKEAMV